MPDEVTAKILCDRCEQLVERQTCYEQQPKRSGRGGDE
jgi:hypothetical protein